MSIMDTQLHPGESLTTLPNGNLVLHMRNGMTQEYTPEEWDEYMADFQMTTVEMIDSLLAGISSRNMVQTGEMVDALLDIRKRAEQTERGFKLAVDMWRQEVDANRDDENEGEL